MCWSPQVSLSTFIIAMAGTALAYVNRLGDPWFWPFLMLFSSMQLVEYFLWTYMQRPAASVAFQAANVMGYVIIMLQPLYILWTIPSEFPYKMHLIAVWALMVAAHWVIEPPRFSAQVGANKHLVWNWIPRNPAIIATWLMLLIGGVYISKQLRGDRSTDALAFLIVTVAISLYTYYQDGTWGSMWCWVSNVVYIWIIVTVLYKMVKEMC